MAYFITEDCSGCTACARLCPVFAISGERGERHAINARRCVECGVCAKACAKEAVADANGKRLPKVPRKDWRKPSIQQEACSACQMCVDICTAEAMAISLPAFRGDLSVYAQLQDSKKCVGCGLCAEICPLGIIEMKGGDAE